VTWSGVVFVASFVSVVYFLIEIIHAWRSPEYRREAKPLREERRLRKLLRRL